MGTLFHLLKMQKSVRLAMLMGCYFAAFATVASKVEARESFIETGEVADAPAGFLEMCARDHSLCSSDAPQKTIDADRLIAPTINYGDSELCKETSHFALLLPQSRSDYEPQMSYGIWGHARISYRNPPDLVLADAVMPALCPTAGLVSEPKLTNKADDVPAVPVNTTLTANKVDRKTMKIVSSINRGVNSAVVQVSDLIAFGKQEFWQRPNKNNGFLGDCEDIALEKKARLLENGISPQSLSLAVVYDMNAGLHTVLIIKTERGDYVLDSLTNAVLRWDQTRFRWLRMQSAANNMNWYRIL